MKRIALFLVVFLLIPFSSFTESTDPIVGCWYICIDCTDLKEMMSDLYDQGYVYSVLTLVFTENGNILVTETDYKETSGESGSTAYLGKWEKDGNNYKTSIIANGVNKAWFEDDLLYVCVFNSSQYHGFRKMEPLDLYYNIYKK